MAVEQGFVFHHAEPVRLAEGRERNGGDWAGTGGRERVPREGRGRGDMGSRDGGGKRWMTWHGVCLGVVEAGRGDGCEVRRGAGAGAGARV